MIAWWAARDTTPLSSTSATNCDRITDFDVAVDRIVLDLSVFTCLTGNGALAAANFRTGSAAVPTEDRIIYDNATGVLSYDADGSGLAAAAVPPRPSGHRP